MLQVAFLLIGSWLVLWLYNKSDLIELGIIPNKMQIKLFLTLFAVTSICCTVNFLFKMYFAKEQYAINHSLTLSLFISGFWETLRGVLTEELLCRGVLLYILIKKIGAKRAIILSSVLFGMLHWLNNGVYGNIIQMSISFTFTFVMGLLLAYAFARTFSILIPISIHLGWNLTQNFIFPDLPAGNGVFIFASKPSVVTVSYFLFFFILLFPKVLAIVMNFIIIKSNSDYR